MKNYILILAAIGTVSLLAACDTLDSDWSTYDAGPTDWSPPSGDNRTHEQQLRDEAWWDDYHRAN